MSSIVLTDLQKNAVKKILLNGSQGLGTVLAFEMGLGKTATVCVAVKKLLENNKERFGKVIIVAPVSVLKFWQDEFVKVGYTGDVCIYHRAFKEEVIPIADCDVAICSYVGAETADLTEFNTIVLDEAHDPLRNGTTKLFKVFRDELSSKPVRIAITGTPINNSAMDLFNLFQWVQPTLFPNKRDFRRFYHLIIKRGLSAKASPEHMTRALSRARGLGKAMKHFIIHHSKEVSGQYSFDVPMAMPQEQQDEYDYITGKHTQVFKKRKKHTLADGDVVFSESHSSDASRLKALKQIQECRSVVAGDNCDVTHLSTFVQEHLDDLLAAGSTAFFFSRLSQMDGCKRLLEGRGISFVEVRGATNPADRAEAVRAHNAGEVQVFLGSETACGVGISLYTLATIVICSPQWNRALTNQISARGSRPQNKNKVIVYNLYANETIEEPMKRVSRLKQRIIDSILGESPIDDAVMRHQAERAKELLSFKRHLE